MVTQAKRNNEHIDCNADRRTALLRAQFGYSLNSTLVAKYETPLRDRTKVKFT